MGLYWDNGRYNGNDYVGFRVKDLKFRTSLELCVASSVTQ